VCRFVLYLGPQLKLSHLLTDPSNSLIYQSFNSRERAEPLNGDGFGVAWYVPEASERPGVFRCISPAWSNRNLHRLAEVTRSGCILAHVRAANRGVIATETNCHPFTHGRYAFMHNGDVGGFQQIRRPLLDLLSDEAFENIEGTTDSEHLFALFLDRIKETSSPDPAEALGQALRACVAQVLDLSKAVGVDEPSYLNLAVADGHCAAVLRLTTDPNGQAESLHYTDGRRYVCTGGVCRMLHPETDGPAVIVSSEPLSQDPGWQFVPPNHLLLVRTDHTIKLEPWAST
jgi:glutamine amidotransferase